MEKETFTKEEVQYLLNWVLNMAVHNQNMYSEFLKLERPKTQTFWPWIFGIYPVDISWIEILENLRKEYDSFHPNTKIDKEKMYEILKKFLDEK